MTAAKWIVSFLTLVGVIALISLNFKQKKARGLKGKESVYAGAWWLTIFVYILNGNQL